VLFLFLELVSIVLAVTIRVVCLNGVQSQNKRRKERERCQAVIDKLHDEEKKQLEHVRMVMALLKERKDTWFGSSTYFTLYMYANI
jgi:hypothetical protein